jgi:rhodanese-related sulfurtransferase
MNNRIISVLLLGIVGIFSCCTKESAVEQKSMSSENLAALIKEKAPGFILIDVRTPEEYAEGHIPTALNVPLADLPDKMMTKDKNAHIVVYCRSGNRSASAQKILVDAGFKNVIDFGAIGKWTGEIVKGAAPQ